MRPAFAGVRRLAVISAAVLVVACSGQPAPTLPGVPSLGPRPSSPATVEIMNPAPSTTVTGTSVHVAVKLTGARIVQQTSTDIRPDEGHLHLYVNNVLVSMNYGLEQDLPVQPGTVVIRAEFVAADHAPFSPRVVSPDVVFTVR
jgi:hypothetical protein